VGSGHCCRYARADWPPPEAYWPPAEPYIVTKPWLYRRVARLPRPITVIVSNRLNLAVNQPCGTRHKGSSRDMIKQLL
jgi:hypothetical protein